MPATPPSAVAAAPARPIASGKTARHQLIQQIEKERGSRVISYVTVGRPSLGTQISRGDTPPLFFRHLRKFGKADRIDLLLETHGGDTLAPGTLVNLLREFTPHLGVLVPRYAMSAGTMIALGANEIVMGCMGRLGPVDPTVSNDFNPDNETTDDKGKKTKNRLSISVEDVSAYLALAKERAGLDPAGMAEALKALTDRVHPLALGNVHRKYLLIREVSKRLLCLHMDEVKDGQKIDRIVNILSEKLYDHGYQIGRREAEEVIGLPVVRPSSTVEDAMWALCESYDSATEIGAPNGAFVVDGGVIESTDFTYSFVYEGVATKTKDSVSIEIKRQAWTLI